MLRKVGKLAKSLFKRRNRQSFADDGHADKPRKKIRKARKRGWGEAYYGYSHPSDAPPRFGATRGHYDNNRPRGLTGLIVEAILRRLSRR